MNRCDPAKHVPQAIEQALDRYLSFVGPPESPRRPQTSDIAVYSFPQTWPNSTCGHGGLALQAFTVADTVVVCLAHEAAVFINGRFSYRAELPCDVFTKDMSGFAIAGPKDAPLRYRIM